MPKIGRTKLRAAICLSTGLLAARAIAQGDPVKSFDPATAAVRKPGSAVRERRSGLCLTRASSLAAFLRDCAFALNEVSIGDNSQYGVIDGVVEGGQFSVG
jgi:hypothetical protein